MGKKSLTGDLLCGLDEAGRGPLAGPVCAAAVILPRDFPSGVLNDSKKLSAAAREKARSVICSSSLAWGVAWASASEIDELNINKASLLAMKRAFEEMLAGTWALSTAGAGFPIESSGIHAVADGLFAPVLPVPCKALVKADSLVPAVMAASILAKTARDRLMEHYGLFYPQYGFERHKGYPTKAHREAILRWGPSPIQRMSFRVLPTDLKTALC
jgi:ribonuclease HII